MSIGLGNYAAKIARSAIDLILPIHCLGCGLEGKFLCSSCTTTFPRLELPYCNVCSVPGTHGVCHACRQQSRFSIDCLSGIRAPYLMEGLVRDAVHAFKYRNYKVAAPQLSELLAEYLGQHLLPGNALFPVPLHRKKLRERGYNQAVLLARELSKRIDLPVAERLLVRTRNSPSQAHSIDSAERRENTEGAFACRGRVDGLACILIDDVCTTGSTLGACAVALMEAGAQSVWALTLARERLHSPEIGP